MQLAEGDLKLEQGYGREGGEQAGILVKDEPDFDGTSSRGEDAFQSEAQEDYDMLEGQGAEGEADADEDLYRDYQLDPGGTPPMQTPHFAQNVSVPAYLLCFAIVNE